MCPAAAHLIHQELAPRKMLCKVMSPLDSVPCTLLHRCLWHHCILAKCKYTGLQAAEKRIGCTSSRADALPALVRNRHGLLCDSGALRLFGFAVHLSVPHFVFVSILFLTSVHVWSKVIFCGTQQSSHIALSCSVYRSHATITITSQFNYD